MKKLFKVYSFIVKDAMYSVAAFIMYVIGIRVAFRFKEPIWSSNYQCYKQMEKKLRAFKTQIGYIKEWFFYTSLPQHKDISFSKIISSLQMLNPEWV